MIGLSHIVLYLCLGKASDCSCSLSLRWCLTYPDQSEPRATVRQAIRRVTTTLASKMGSSGTQIPNSPSSSSDSWRSLPMASGCLMKAETGMVTSCEGCEMLNRLIYHVKRYAHCLSVHEFFLGLVFSGDFVEVQCK